MGLSSKLAAACSQQGAESLTTDNQSGAATIVAESAAAVAVTDGNGNVGVSAASVATVHTQVTYGSSNHRNSTSLAAHNNSFNGSDAFQAAYGGSHHGGSAPPTPPQHSSAFQVAYGGSNGGTGQLQAPTPQQHSSAFQAAYGGSHRSNSAPPTPPQHSSVFQTAYGNSHHGSSVSLASYDGSYYGSNASLAGYDGSFHGSDAFQAVYGSGASDIDSEDEVLVLQEVTAEEAQRLLAVGQIDQEVDIDNGGATKKHKLSGRFSSSKKPSSNGAPSNGAASSGAFAHGATASHVEHADLVDIIPVLSQMKSAFQLACGDKEGAKKTQSNMTKGLPGLSQLRSAVELAKGDKEAAKATQHHQYVALKTYGGHMPGVGHCMATYHAGQSLMYKGRRNQDKAQLAKAKAKHELSGSTRTLFVGMAGVTGAAMTAGLDGGATAAALGVSAGVTYDGTLTLLSGKRKGYFAVAHKVKRKDMTPGEIFNAALMPVGDALVAGAAEATADKASMGADGSTLADGNAYGVDAPQGSDANTLDAGEQDAATAVGVLSKIIKPDFDDVDHKAEAARDAAAAAAAAAGVAISAQAPHQQGGTVQQPGYPRQQPGYPQQEQQALRTSSMSSALSVAPSDASSTVFHPLQPAHSLGRLSLGSAPSDASFVIAGMGAPPLEPQPPQQPQLQQHPPNGLQLPSIGGAPPLPPQAHAQLQQSLQRMSVAAAPPQPQLQHQDSMGGALPQQLHQHLHLQHSSMSGAPPLPQQHTLHHTSIGAPPQPQISMGGAPQLQQSSMGFAPPSQTQQPPYQNFQRPSMGSGDMNAGIAAAAAPGVAAAAAAPQHKSYAVPTGVNTAYLKQAPPPQQPAYNGYAAATPGGVPPPQQYQGQKLPPHQGQTQQPYPVQHQNPYQGQQAQPYQQQYQGQQQYPAQQQAYPMHQQQQAYQQYQQASLPGGQQAPMMGAPQMQQQPFASGLALGGKFGSKLKSKMNMP